MSACKTPSSSKQVASYQNTVLKAGEEVENGLVTFILAHSRTRAANVAVNAEKEALKEAIAQYRNGLVDYHVVVDPGTIESSVSEHCQRNRKGQIAQGLIQVYRSLGGGWQIRCEPEAAPADSVAEFNAPNAPEEDVADGSKNYRRRSVAKPPAAIAEGRSFRCLLNRRRQEACPRSICRLRGHRPMHPSSRDAIAWQKSTSAADPGWQKDQHSAAMT